MVKQGLVNFLIGHHPPQGIISKRYFFQVMFKITKMAHLPNRLKIPCFVMIAVAWNAKANLFSLASA